jgi:glycosyltransferase involved in cell wall biosynthesis
MSSPFFSVVIPTYNRANFILKTLQTVFDQTYRNFEIIVVDNCSTDNTEELLRPFHDAGRLRFIKHDRNYERARSRNTGMGAARGDFVTLLDSDDLMYPSNLADAAEFVASNPSAKCFHNLSEIVSPEGRLVYRQRFPPLKDQARAIASGNFLSCIGDFIHREIYQTYQFDTHPLMTGAEDWDFWLRVLADYPLGRIPRVNSGIVQHAGRSVQTQDLTNLEAGLRMLREKLAAEPRLRAVYGPHLRRIEANSFIYLAILSNSGGLHGNALSYLRRAAAADPTAAVRPRYLRVLQLALAGKAAKSRHRSTVTGDR